jgi:hypothetical protein
LTAGDEGFGQVRSDETGAAGDEIGAHSVDSECTRQSVKPACERPGVTLSAF